MNNRIARLLGALAAAFLLNPASHAAEMVLPSEVATTHWKTGYMNQFAEEVKTKTNGQLVVKVFPAGQLYNDQDAMAALGTGAVHMVWPVAVRLETLDPRTGIINLPFVLSDDLMTNQCFNGELTKLISSYVEPRKLQVLGFLRTSDLLFIFKDRDVKKMEDLKGAKVRVTGGKVFLDTMRSLNMSPVSMAASEMSTALSQGAIDGIFTSPAGWAEMVGMTAKYAWYVPGMSVATYAVIVDKAWLDGLPAVQRKAVTDSIADIALRQWKEAIEADKKLVHKMTTQGAVFRTADAAEIKRWRERAAPGNKLFTDKHPDVTQKLAAIEGKCGVAK
ncbi:MAG TPA: TRAP transporter substrate-binding protein DctP [Usitatibacter sp.]|nr:TRAP transporter substrate-binding protein DctP [Usitatibacter sp.]